MRYRRAMTHTRYSRSSLHTRSSVFLPLEWMMERDRFLRSTRPLRWNTLVSCPSARRLATFDEDLRVTGEARGGEERAAEARVVCGCIGGEGREGVSPKGGVAW